MVAGSACVGAVTGSANALAADVDGCLYCWIILTISIVV